MRLSPIILALAGLLVVCFAITVQADSGPKVTDLKIEVGEEVERVSLYSSEKLVHKKLFFLSKPDRLVIDFPVVDGASKIHMDGSYKGRLINNIRYGRYDAATSRMVIDLRHPVSKPALYAVPPESQKDWRFVVDLAVEGRAAKVPLESPAVITKTPTVEEIVSDKPDIDTEDMARAIQKDDAKPLVVIDAGHGGKDPGATGVSGGQEKDVTLTYARALRSALLRTGRYRVLMTRDSDNFILLHDRVKMARKEKAQLFISLHADAHPTADARGLSIYTLSETASDKETELLAQQENKVDELGGLDLKTEDEDVADILRDLATRETKNKSYELAEAILDSLDKKIKTLPKPHRYAGFRVLKTTDIPAALVEIGFLSNSEDEKLLSSQEYRDKVVRSVVKGVDTFFGH